MPKRLSRVLVAATALPVVALATTHAIADVFRFTPALLIEQIFTDNVRGDTDDRDADGVTTLGLRLAVEYDSSRIDFATTADVYYNEYWGTNEFDNFNGDGDAALRLTVFDDRLFIDGAASRREVFLAPDETSGTGLSTGTSAQQTNWAAGPLLTLNMFDLADLAVRGTYAHVSFDDPINDALLVPPVADVTAKSVNGRLTTGERHTTYELAGTGEYLETDDDFTLRNAVGHALVHITPMFSAIGRYGYERIEDPSFAPIRGPRWSVGGRFNFSETSFVRVEYGERFDDINWSGEANIQISSRVLLNAEYTDILQPAQLANLRVLDELFDESGNIALPQAPEPFEPNLTLLGQIVRDRNFRATTSYTRGLQTFSLVTRHNEREIPGLASNEKQFGVDLGWRETMSRSMTGSANLVYIDTYEPAIGNLASELYRAELAVNYLYTNEIQFTGRYVFAHTARENDTTTQINVLLFGMVRAF